MNSEELLNEILISQENLLAEIRRCMLAESVFLMACGFTLVFLVIKGMVIGTYFKINLLLIIAIVLGGFSLIKTFRLYRDLMKVLVEFCDRSK